jgi:PAS domain S-box-containing protein
MTRTLYILNSDIHYNHYLGIQMKIKIIIFTLMTVLVLLISVTHSYHIYIEKKDLFLKNIDDKLFTAATMAKATLPDGYHDHLFDSTSVSKVEYDIIVEKYNRLCVELDLEYIWSLMKIDGVIVFTTSTSPDKIVANQNHAKFFEIHSNPATYDDVFSSMEPQYQDNIDKWGSIKTVLIPYTDIHGRQYLFGSSMKSYIVEKLISKDIKESIFLSFLFLLAALLLSYFFAKLLSKSFSHLIKETSEIASGNFNKRIEEKGFFEQVELIKSFNRMSLTINDKIAELVKSEEYQRITLNSIGDAVIATDDHGKITSMNPIAENLTGWMLEDAVGKPLVEVFNIINALTNEPALNPVKMVLESGKIVGLANHTVLISKSGKRYHIADSGAPIKDLNKNIIGVVLVFRDVSEEYQMQEELEASETRFKALHNASFGGIAIHDKGIILECNNGLSEISGYESDELMGMDGLLLVDEESRKEVRENILSGFEKPYEVFGIRKNGEKYPLRIEARGVPYKGRNVRVVEFRDISERKKAEEALRGIEAKQRAMISNISDVIAIIDKERINRYKSPNVEKWFGWKPEELVGKNTFENIHPDDHDHTQKIFSDILLKSNSTKTSESRYLCKDGNYKWMEFTAVNLLNDPNINGILLNYHDIGERKTAEQERNLLEDQLRQSQKIESIGHLAGGIAHDFNNLLTPIIGTTELAMLNISPDEPLFKELEEIQQTAFRAADLTRQLLAFSRKQVLTMNSVNLDELIENFRKILRRTIREDIIIDVKKGSGKHQVKVDESQIEQILMNLLVNAQDAMPGGGTIIIETDIIELDQEYTNYHLDVNPGRYVELIVSDTGEGIDQKTLKRIFDPFFTTKAVDKGTGLGLATVHGIIKQHDGHIWVYSEKGIGTTFKLFLPIIQEESHEELNKSNEAKSVFGTGDILIVEDQKEVGKIAARILQAKGYKAQVANNFQEALSILKNRKLPIDLLLTDIIMPNMNGKELYGELSKVQPGLKVLYMSGYTQEVIAHHGVLEEGLNFIQKPLTISTLTKKVKDVLES